MLLLQAEVEGQKITWLTPHALQQVLTDDVDFNVMLTFLEFYEVMYYKTPLSTWHFAIQEFSCRWFVVHINVGKPKVAGSGWHFYIYKFKMAKPTTPTYNKNQSTI